MCCEREGKGGCDGDGDARRERPSCWRADISETSGICRLPKREMARKRRNDHIDAQHPKATQVISSLRREVQRSSLYVRFRWRKVRDRWDAPFIVVCRYVSGVIKS